MARTPFSQFVITRKTIRIQHHNSFTEYLELIDKCKYPG